jgi:hypothetical protein
MFSLDQVDRLDKLINLFAMKMDKFSDEIIMDKWQYNDDTLENMMIPLTMCPSTCLLLVHHITAYRTFEMYKIAHYTGQTVPCGLKVHMHTCIHEYNSF